MKLAQLIFLALFFFSCNGGGDGFSGLNDTNIIDDDSSTAIDDEAIVIESFTPASDPVVLTSTGSATLAIQINSGAGAVNYKYLLDNVVVQDSSSSFYLIDATGIASGNHVVKVIATNSVGSEEKSFNVRKNSPPSVSLDSNTSQTINCVSDTFTLQIAATDPDGDSLSFDFLLNGGSGSSFLTTSSGLSSASAVFDPNCSLSGSNTVTIRVTDQNGESSDYSMAVTVTNPNVASVDSFSPTADPVVILSNETKSFLISASGNPPLAYSWGINPGSTLVTCNNSSSCDVSGGDFTPGNYILSATVTDSLSTSDTKAFNVTINDRPQISFSFPSNAETVKMNCSSSKNFQIQVSDLNHSDGQSFSIEWFVDGLSNAALSNTNNLAVHPMTSDATFSPNCSSLLIGDHKIKAVVSDGFENQEIEWDVSVNYFSDECNNLSSGEICTISGLLGQGSGLSTDSDNDQVRVRPEFLASYPSGGYFFTDGYRHAVWFYNDTSSPVTVFGKSVAAKTLISLFGQTQWGVGTDGQSFNNYYLRDPRGIAYSTVENALYVADQNNNRIVRFNSSGQGYRWAGGGSSNVDGDPRKSHKCNDPIGIDLDDANGLLFSSCYSNTNGADGTVKVFQTGADIGNTVVRYSGNAATNGSTGIGGSARFARSRTVKVDPNARLVYFGDDQRCRIMVASYGDSGSFYSGAVTVSSGNAVRLTNNSACGENYNRLYTDTGARIRVYDIAPFNEGGVTKGLFFTNYNRHVINFLNFTGSAITLGGQTIGANRYDRVFGTNNSADYARGVPAYTSSLLRNPYGIRQIGSTLYIADRGNNRLSYLDVSTGNGATGDIVGNLPVGDYDDELPKNSNLRRYNRPRDLTFNNGLIYVADSANRRIRSLNVTTGEVLTVIGRGAYGNANTNPEDPLDVYFQDMGQIDVSSDGNSLLYADGNGGNGANRNCMVRLFNSSGSSESLYGLSIDNNKVTTVAGNFPLGCNTWNSGTYNNGAAISARLDRPWGVMSLDDQSSFYMSSYDSSCIYEVDSSGIINERIGQCNSTGDVSGAFASAKLLRPGPLVKDSDASLASVGNFFIVDRYLNTNSYIKYANFSGADVDIFGLTIPSGEVGKVISTDGYSGDVATFEDQICYSQGANANGHQYPHNVICLDRNTGVTTLRVGKISASTVKCATPQYDEEEGVLATSASLCGPWGLTFDSEGNLYIAEYISNNIRMVKRWY